MSIYHKILEHPIITEKNTLLRSEENKYVFKVQRKANKSEIKRAIESIFNVNVTNVNTMVVKGKVKRRGRFVGKRPDWKKAIVKVEDGQVIENFGEV